MDWYLEWFGEEYLELYAHRSDEEATRQVEFVLEHLPAEPPKHVLDVACGRGRHVYELARRGIDTIGIDTADAALDAAREKLAEFSSHARVEKADMRDLPFADSSFDLIISMFTSFGYFKNDIEHLALLNEWKRCIHATGWIFIDYMNRERTVAGLIPESTEEYDDKIVAQRRFLSSDGKRVNKEITITNKTTNEVSTFNESVRLYDYNGMNAILHGASLKAAAVFGDFDGSSYSPDSNRLLIFAKPDAG
ncbi:MAG: class I SAM-dependent methyltransferase [Bdellovibrionales bacterium]|nr:class I SAM-dependent methyltransferase [Bdellovibrionales bacterium]